MTTLISGTTHRGLNVYVKQTPDPGSGDQSYTTISTIQVIFTNKAGQRYVGSGTPVINGTGAVAPQFNYFLTVADYVALGVGEWWVSFKGTWQDTTIDFTLPSALEIQAAP